MACFVRPFQSFKGTPPESSLMELDGWGVGNNRRFTSGSKSTDEPKGEVKHQEFRVLVRCGLPMRRNGRTQREQVPGIEFSSCKIEELWQ